MFFLDLGIFPRLLDDHLEARLGNMLSDYVRQEPELDAPHRERAKPIWTPRRSSVGDGSSGKLGEAERERK